MLDLNRKNLGRTTSDEPWCFTYSVRAPNTNGGVAYVTEDSFALERSDGLESFDLATGDSLGKLRSFARYSRREGELLLHTPSGIVAHDARSLRKLRIGRIPGPLAHESVAAEHSWVMPVRVADREYAVRTTYYRIGEGWFEWPTYLEVYELPTLELLWHRRCGHVRAVADDLLLVEELRDKDADAFQLALYSIADGASHGELRIAARRNEVLRIHEHVLVRAEERRERRAFLRWNRDARAFAPWLELPPGANGPWIVGGEAGVFVVFDRTLVRIDESGRIERSVSLAEGPGNRAHAATFSASLEGSRISVLEGHPTEANAYRIATFDSHSLDRIGESGFVRPPSWTWDQAEPRRWQTLTRAPGNRALLLGGLQLFALQRIA